MDAVAVRSETIVQPDYYHHYLWRCCEERLLLLARDRPHVYETGRRRAARRAPAPRPPAGEGPGPLPPGALPRRLHLPLRRPPRAAG